MALATTAWNVQDHLGTPEEIAAFLEAVFEAGDPKEIAAALGEVARSKGMAGIAKEAGVTREALYRALSRSGDPRLSTFLGVARALDLEVTVRPRTGEALAG